MCECNCEELIGKYRNRDSCHCRRNINGNQVGFAETYNGVLFYCLEKHFIEIV